MTSLVFVALALAGGFGAAARLLVDGLIKSRVTNAVPWGTILINVTGSLGLGLLAGLGLGHMVPEALHQIIGSGFLGAYTTFSTASFETVRMLQERRWLAAVTTGVGVLILATGFAGLGMWVGISF